MFKPATLKIIAYISLIGCIIGFAATAYRAVNSSEWKYYMFPISWLLLVLSSYWAIKIVKNYEYADNFRRIGWYIYLILFFFILFCFANLTIGIFPISFLAISLDSRKREIDEQINENQKI